jgi:hypothetical protein
MPALVFQELIAEPVPSEGEVSQSFHRRAFDFFTYFLGCLIFVE